MTTSVDTNNWDAVYAIHFSTLNQSIIQQWKPITMQFEETDDSMPDVPIKYVLDATFAPWQLALGGDGKNVRFTCPIQSGTFSSQKPDGTVAKTYSFPQTGPKTTIVIEVGMEWIPDPSQQFFAIADKPTIDSLVAALDSQTTVPTALVQLFAKNNIILDISATVNIYTPGWEWAILNKDQYFYVLYARQLDNNQQVEAEFLYVYKFSQQWKANLQLLIDDIKEGGSAVTVTNILNSPIPAADKTPALMFEEVITEWFNVNLGDFATIFAQANVTTT
ncbi:MAG: TULIP family P47-like protein, partial [Microcystaceae cyanobacterium]